MRFAAVRPPPSTAAEAVSLPFVGDSQALPPFGAAPLEDNPAIFRRHAYPETVRFLAATGIGLVGALPLHGVLVSADRVWRTVNSNRRLNGVSTQDPSPRRCATVPASRFAGLRVAFASTLGFFPKISTTVENTVENASERLS